MQILFPFPVKDPPLYYIPDTRHKLRITKSGEVSPAAFRMSISAGLYSAFIFFFFRAIRLPAQRFAIKMTIPLAYIIYFL